jgi:hypothetical protein
MTRVSPPRYCGIRDYRDCSTKPKSRDYTEYGLGTELGLDTDLGSEVTGVRRSMFKETLLIRV